MIDRAENGIGLLGVRKRKWSEFEGKARWRYLTVKEEKK